MAEPELVARCVAAMQARVRVPVTVKCRIGIDDQDSEADLERFIADGGRRRLPHLHRARAQGLAAGAVAQGEPRDPAARLWPRLPPQGGASRAGDRHQRRHRRRSTRPRRTWRTSTASALGRAAYQNPYLLAEVDRPAVRRRGAAALAPRRVSKQLDPLRRAARARAAAGSTMSRGTSWASTTAGRARAPSAATSSEQAPRAGRGRRGAAGGDAHCRRRAAGAAGGGGIEPAPG